MISEPWYVTESKKRCDDFGIDADGIPSFSKFLSDQELQRKREDYEEVLSVVEFLAHNLLELMKGIPLFIIITDECGCILETAGDTTIKNVFTQTGVKMGLIFT